MRVRWAALVFVLTMAVEIVVFILVGQLIGFAWTILLVLATSLLGGWLLRREGVRAWSRFRQVAGAGGRPGPHLTRSLVGLAGALLLVVPGFVTDLIGAALFIPPVRTLAGAGITGLVTRRLSSSVASDLFGPRLVRVRLGKPTRGPDTSTAAPAAAEIVEGEVIDPR